MEWNSIPLSVARNVRETDIALSYPKVSKPYHSTSSREGVNMFPSEREFRFASNKKSNEMSTADLLKKAKLYLKVKENQLLLEILALFDNKECTNFSPILLAVEMIFTELLRRKEMFEVITPLKPTDQSPAAIQCRWLREAYGRAKECIVSCFGRGVEQSREQALVTGTSLLREEGLNPLDSSKGFVNLPTIFLKNMLMTMLDSNESMSHLIVRFRPMAEFRDIQQYGLKIISLLAVSHPTTCDIPDDLTEEEVKQHFEVCDQHSPNKVPSETFIRNYLELFYVLMSSGLPSSNRAKYQLHPEDQYLCTKEGRTAFIFNTEACKRYVNRCWGYVMQWPLRASTITLQLALLLLVDRVMPHLARPQLVVDLLADCMDKETAISSLALRGMMELVTRHCIEYPDIYDRLYGMFEPEMFATRSKKRLIHLAEIFLSSTRISLATVAAFAKRLSRLAMIALPEDAYDILRLVSVLIVRHPGLKKMINYDDPPVMPKDPYVMEEANAISSRAINSSLWEVAAMGLHFAPEVCQSAMRCIATAKGTASPDPSRVCDNERFDAEVRRRFRTIELNFVRLPGFVQVANPDTDGFGNLRGLWDTQEVE